MGMFCSFIDVRLLEYRGVEAQQLGVAPIGFGARSKPAHGVCQVAKAARPNSMALREAVEAAGTGTSKTPPARPRYSPETEARRMAANFARPPELP